MLHNILPLSAIIHITRSNLTLAISREQRTWKIKDNLIASRLHGVVMPDIEENMSLQKRRCLYCFHFEHKPYFCQERVLFFEKRVCFGRNPHTEREYAPCHCNQYVPITEATDALQMLVCAQWSLANTDRERFDIEQARLEMLLRRVIHRVRESENGQIRREA
jgi:hypothetical protein